MSRRPDTEDREWSNIGRVIGGRTTEMSGDDMCGLHCVQGDEEHKFFYFGFKTKVDDFSRFGLKTGGYEFFGLGLKINSYGLVIWISKSPCRFLGLGLKTKWFTVCRLCHKSDGKMKTARDTHRDLAAYFAWK
jgi:hypothetical protein